MKREGMRVATLIDGVRDLARSLFERLPCPNAVASIGFRECSIVIHADPFRAGKEGEAVIHLARSPFRYAIRNEMGVTIRVVKTCQDVQGMARVG